MKRTITLAALLLAAFAGPAAACGWWGEETGSEAPETVTVGPASQMPDIATPEGMARMARAYRTGEGVPQDDLVARRWARLAAEAGHAGAMNDYAQMLEFGIGGAEDLAEAAAWYARAAEAGNPQAMHSLAHMLLEGRGVPVDRDRAAELLRRSAAAGHASAAEELADMLWSGALAPREADEACLWSLVAGLSGPGQGADPAACREHEPGLTEERLAALQARAAGILRSAEEAGS